MHTTLHYNPALNVGTLTSTVEHGAEVVEMFTVPAYFAEMNFFNVCGVEMVELRSAFVQQN